MNLTATDLSILLGAVAIVAFAATFAFGPDGAEKTTRRLKGVAGNAKQANTRGKITDPHKERRRHITENLKRIEDKQEGRTPNRRVPLETRLQRAGWSLTVRDFWMLSGIIGLAFIMVGILSGQAMYVTAALGFVGSLGVPRLLLARARAKRQKKFTEEFANAIDTIVRGVKSGLPVNECMKIVSRDAQSPVKEEFQYVLESQRVGLSMEEALGRFFERMPLSEVNFFAIVLVIQQQTGGNLAVALGNLSGVLRSRRTMLGKVAALSMEAKASAVILGSMPVFVTTMLTFAAPEYLEPLYTTTLGKTLLVVAAVLMSMGIFIMRSMIRIKV